MKFVLIILCFGLLLIQQASGIATEEEFGHSHDDHHPCFNHLVARLNRIEARLRGELALLKDQLKRNPAAQKSADQLKKKITTLKSVISPPTQKVDSPSSAAGYPTSCMDLYQRGHFLNAFYPVLKNDKIDFIFCNFTSQSLLSYQDRASGLETRIGSADVKTSPIYFHVRKNKSLNENATVPFEITIMNVGNAMNLTSGRFTAPKTGLYHFAYSGISRSFSKKPFPTFLYLVLNGAQHHQASSYGTAQSGWRVLTFDLPLKLQAGDGVVLTTVSQNNATGILERETDVHLNGFNGYLLEESLKLI